MNIRFVGGPLDGTSQDSGFGPLSEIFIYGSGNTDGPVTYVYRLIVESGVYAVHPDGEYTREEEDRYVEIYVHDRHNYPVTARYELLGKAI